MTGEAQVPVQPHIPHVMKTISAHARACLISSEDSSAAFLPISGLAQAHNHLVVALPILILICAFEVNRACASVFTPINSTHSSHAAIMRFTALHHPQPTHTTLILATGDM
jgi:hypothetical protein